MSIRIALVGDYSPAVHAHLAIPGILGALGGLEVTWLATVKVDPGALDGIDGIWLVPGSPYRSLDGAVLAARTARERGTPVLGTCGGFQHMLIEYARTVCGLAAGHAEYSRPENSRPENSRPENSRPENSRPENSRPENSRPAEPLIVPLACALIGESRPVRVVPGTLAATLLGATHRDERYRCSYGLAPGAEAALVARGLLVSGRDEDGSIRIVELPGHPFWLATGFQPELAAGQPHPLIAGFARAAQGRSPGDG